MLATQNAPFQFALSAAELATHNVLQLHMHRSVAHIVQPLLSSSPIVKDGEEFLGSTFRGELAPGSVIGFASGLLKCHSWHNDRLVIDIELPASEIEKGLCPGCAGTGRDGDNYDCLWCSGGGKETVQDSAAARAVALSLSVLLRALRSQLTKPKHCVGPLQLLEVATCVTDGQAAFDGAFSPVLVTWLTHATDQELDPIRDAVFNAYDHMLPSRVPPHSRERYGLIRNPGGWISWSCLPGSSSLHPEYDFPDSDTLEYGYHFESHNCDEPEQQLTLLAGLAGLHDAAVAAGVGQ